MNDTSTNDLRVMTDAITSIIPDSALVHQRLPDAPELSLALLDDTYPQHALDQAAINRIMAFPLYWVFCWASGQVLARFLLDNPEWVRNRRVLDFGAGSGVAAIAAARAGAREVIACDLDEVALAACRYNADLNDVQLLTANNFDAVSGSLDLILAADVLYDRENLHWLSRFRARAENVLIADSRIRNFDEPGFRRIAAGVMSNTMPDLDESSEFRSVALYSADSYTG